MNILAIDPATITGWATKNGYGVWNLTKRPNESDGIKWLRFRNQLRELVELENITVIVYERPGGRHAGATIHHSKLIAIIEVLCAELGIEYAGYSSSQIKRKATGRGNANKADVIQAAVEILGYVGNDDNEADALWLYELACSDLS